MTSGDFNPYTDKPSAPTFTQSVVPTLVGIGLAMGLSFTGLGSLQQIVVGFGLLAVGAGVYGWLLRKK